MHQMAPDRCATPRFTALAAPFGTRLVTSRAVASTTQQYNVRDQEVPNATTENFSSVHRKT